MKQGASAMSSEKRLSEIKSYLRAMEKAPCKESFSLGAEWCRDYIQSESRLVLDTQVKPFEISEFTDEEIDKLAIQEFPENYYDDSYKDNRKVFKEVFKKALELVRKKMGE